LVYREVSRGPCPKVCQQSGLRAEKLLPPIPVRCQGRGWGETALTEPFLGRCKGKMGGAAETSGTTGISRQLRQFWTPNLGTQIFLWTSREGTCANLARWVGWKQLPSHQPPQPHAPTHKT